MEDVRGFQRVETIPGQIERRFSGKTVTSAHTLPHALKLRAVLGESVLLRHGRQFGNGHTTWPADRSLAAPQRDVEILPLNKFRSLSLDFLSYSQLGEECHATLHDVVSAKRRRAS